MRSRQLPPLLVSLALALFLSVGPSCDSTWAQTAGVDVAVPRVAVVSIGSTLMFNPSAIPVEQGDYVQWINAGAGSHTTTSGAPCVATGLWNVALGAGVQFTRRFLETPGTIPYFCVPHCSFGMTGTVRLTSPIILQAVDNSGTVNLSWTGGGPTYQVFRSSSPGFVGSAPIQPTGGDTGTAFSDATAVSVGNVNYYLVTNQ